MLPLSNVQRPIIGYDPATYEHGKTVALPGQRSVPKVKSIHGRVTKFVPLLLAARNSKSATRRVHRFFGMIKFRNFVLVFGLWSGMLASAQSGTGGDWHMSVSPYLWFPGVHGTLGAFDRDASVSASAIDLLSHFRFGLMGTAEARRGRLLFPVDVFWVRLADDKAVTRLGLAATTADVKASLFILTPKIGVRLLDEPKIKCDFLTGVRYWHLGQTLNFNRSDLSFSTGQNWVDPLVGGRIESPLSSKFVATVFGDVGGWGTGSQLEYQVGGVLGYKVNETATLQAGYRYLAVDYRGGGVRQPVFDGHLSGVVLGVTFNLK